MISVVIPTRGRPQLLQRAIRSVLVQTYQDFEVVVVLDGVDAKSAAAIEEFKEPRIQLLTLPQPMGGAAARNAGVVVARGRWIAFLDDDDEFRAEKLALQLKSAMHSGSIDRTLTVCKVNVVGDRVTGVWPTRFPGPGESIVEYLFCRKSLRQGEAFLQSSTYFVSRILALRVPFRQNLKRHQDWDWVVRLQREAGVKIVALPQVLTVYHRDDVPSVSRQGGWETSLDWGKSTVAPESPRAYSFFIATQCVTRLDAEQCWEWSVLRQLSGECFESGSAGPLCIVLFAYFWLRALYRSRRVPQKTQGIHTKPESISAPEN